MKTRRQRIQTSAGKVVITLFWVLQGQWKRKCLVHLKVDLKRVRRFVNAEGMAVRATTNEVISFLMMVRFF